MGVDIDDVDPSIVYSGSWQASVGSTRQWGGGTIHSTTQNGASATISFRGTRIIMYCTVLMGDGSETVNMNFDGHSGSLTRHSHGDTTYYYDNWFDSGPVDDGMHTLVVSNGGGPSDTPFQLDAFHIEGSGPIKPAVTAPTPPPPPPPPPQPTPVQVTTTKVATATVTTTNVSSTGASSSGASSAFKSSSTSSSSTPSGAFSAVTTTNSGGDKTVVTVQYITTGADGSVTTRIADAPSSALNSTSHSPIAAIVGGVLGSLLLILLLLLLLCLRRRRNAARHIQLSDDAEKHLNSRPRNPTAVTPFQLDANGSSGRNSGTVIAPAHENGVAPKFGLFSTPPTTYPTTPSSAALIAGAPSSSVYHSSSSEKSADHFSNSSPTDESMYVSSPSHDTHPPRLHEADAGPYRPRYLSGDTIIAATNSMYASTMLAPHDTNDFPPSYHQSSRSNSTSQPLPLVPSFN
ncbi:hypothetical protein GALMADRAFT_223786 [Galerina marginata CBS 339.88]|uniref:Uncharacterized protein n=1 Tax=Galerina marginata (strain CBS 339.88) TaxID=685588 RepID=A0A067T8Z7_GALM3|nr:hypothetical protein GALMADRAFT_223786 [Galerina marginata CBS 339.88]